MPTVKKRDIEYLRKTADEIKRDANEYTRGVSAGLLLALTVLELEEGQA